MGEVDDAQLGTAQAHVLDDVGGAALAQGKLIAVAADLLHQADEGVHNEGIVLRRDGKDTPCRCAALILLLEEVGLLDHLAGVGEEAGALLRQGDAAVCARQDGDAHFALQVLHSLGHGGLAHVERLRGLVEGPIADDGDQVAKLLEFHSAPFRAIPRDGGFLWRYFSIYS